MVNKRCGVPLCKSDARKKDKSVSFHKFPTDKLYLKKWICAIKRERGKNLDPKNSFVCSKHFNNTDFTFAKLKKRLKFYVVPSIFPWSQVKPESERYKRHKKKHSDRDAVLPPSPPTVVQTVHEETTPQLLGDANSSGNAPLLQSTYHVPLVLSPRGKKLWVSSRGRETINTSTSRPFSPPRDKAAAASCSHTQPRADLHIVSGERLGSPSHDSPVSGERLVSPSHDSPVSGERLVSPSHDAPVSGERLVSPSHESPVSGERLVSPLDQMESSATLSHVSLLENTYHVPLVLSPRGKKLWAASRGRETINTSTSRPFSPPRDKAAAASCSHTQPRADLHIVSGERLGSPSHDSPVDQMETSATLSVTSLHSSAQTPIRSKEITPPSSPELQESDYFFTPTRKNSRQLDLSVSQNPDRDSIFKSFFEEETQNSADSTSDNASHEMSTTTKKRKRKRKRYTKKQKVEYIDMLLNPETPSRLELKNKIKNLQNQHFKSQFSILKFIDDDKSIKFYTGFQNYSSFYNFFQLLSPQCYFLNYLGKSDEVSEEKEVYEMKKAGRPRSLNAMNEFFMVMVRLRQGLPLKVLGDMFGVSKSYTSKIINTWIIFLAETLKQVNIWPSREHLDKTTPSRIKKMYERLRIIIDCTEFFIEHPSATTAQRESFSSYKHHNTAKSLLGISATGQITFFTRLYAGRCSDKKIVRHCGLLDILEPGDQMLADRGFDIAKDCNDRQVELNIPAFLSGRDQLTKEEVEHGRKVSNVRVHVERAVRKVKEFKILSGVIPITLAPSLDNIWLICCHLANFTGRLINYDSDSDDLHEISDDEDVEMYDISDVD